MKDVRLIQLDLLCEMDSICRKLHIPYTLSRHTAREAMLYHALPARVSVPTVIMRYPDALRLAKEMEKAGKHWECSLDNRNIPGCTLRISDPDSFYFRSDAQGQYRLNGLGVDVELVRPVPGNRLLAKGCIALEAACVMLANIRNHSRIWHFVLGIFKPLEKLLLKTLYRSTKDAAHLRISRFPKKSISFPARLMKETEEISLSGHSFPISRDFDRYMQIEFDENWQTRAAGDEEDMHLAILGTAAEKADMERIVSALPRTSPSVNWVHWYILRGRMRFMRRKIEHYWHILFLTRDRFSLLRKYMPEKQHLLGLYESGEREELTNAMLPYLDAMARHWKNGLVLCFDKELMDVALTLLEESGKGNYACNLRKNVIPQHLKPMKLEGYDHE